MNDVAIKEKISVSARRRGRGVQIEEFWRISDAPIQLGGGYAILAWGTGLRVAIFLFRRLTRINAGYLAIFRLAASASKGINF